MTIKELKQKISDLPDNMDVMLSQYNDECHYSMSETAEVMDVEFQDPDMHPKDWATEKCFVITDEL